MADAKERVADSLVKARANLEQALADLEHLPGSDAMSMAYAGHALLNYLTVTGLTADLLFGVLEHHPNPQVVVWLQGIRHATELMTQIATELMKRTTIQQTPRLTPERVHLPMMVERARAYYQRRGDAKRIRVTWGGDVQQPFAWADRVATAVVLENLLSNAIKYAPPGSEVQITVREEANFLVCSVQDQGPGLSEEDQAKLFQRGARLSSVPTGGEVSTGYGLAVAKELIEAQEGTIWCESRLGRGARFSFRVPQYHGQDSAPPTP